jgi:apolipoprotein N-acyltransferase
LLLPEVTEQYARHLRDRILAEPITAIITIPLAFVGPIIWEISWLSYPLVVWLVRGRRRSKKV